MSDPEDGADRDGPSDDPPDEDPFVYPSDALDQDPSTGPDGEGPRDADTPPDADANVDPDPTAGSDAASTGGADPRPDASTAGGRADSRTDASRTAASNEGSVDERPRGVRGWLRWFWTTDSGVAVYTRDVLTSVAAVLLVGLVLFAVSGIWPPMVAVESPSMEPNMNTGDLVFVVDNDRFVPDAAVSHDGRTTGVVPAERAADVGHSEFGARGDVIIFMPDGDDRQTPVIHRAMLFVEEGDDWYDRAAAIDQAAVGNADSCEELNNCPAPHAGFVTKGDNNEKFDQQTTLSSPVKPEWVIGTAELKVPYLGYVRLAFSGQVAPAPGTAMGTAGAGGTAGPTTSPTLDTSTPAPTGSSPTAAPAGGAGRPVA